jgi:acetyltransferase-like isoleucine patch superfamily enzyme
MISKLILIIIYYYQGIKNRIFRYLLKGNFKSIGKNVSFKYTDNFSYNNISLGSDVYIGPGALFMSSDSEIIIKNKVLFGPNVSIITGDHPIDLRGKYIFDIVEKKTGEDLPVIINDDVWVGAGATILKGVNIGEGAVIASSALVIKDVEPYSIVGGIPARHIKYRGSKEQIKDHKDLIIYNEQHKI